MDQIDFKRLFTTFIICMAIIWAWQWYNGKYNPQPTPQQQSQQDQDRRTDPAQTGDIAATALAAGQGQWHLLLTPETINPQITLGSLLEQDKYNAAVTLDPTTGAVSNALLSQFKFHVDDETTGYPLLSVARPARGRTALSLMCGQMRLFGRAETFDLTRACWVASQLTTDPCGVQSIDYTAAVVDENNVPMLKIVKTYRCVPGDYELQFDLAFENLTDTPLQVESLEFYGPAGLMREDPRMDRRTVAVAYQGNQDDFELEKAAATGLANEPGKEVLQIERSPGRSLRWMAVSNKFFTAIVRPLPADNAERVDYVDADTTEARWLSMTDPDREDQTLPSLGLSVVLQMDRPLASGQELTYPFRLYMGPIDKDIFDSTYPAQHYEKLIPVSWCAFEWLTFGLLKILKAIYGLVGNYGVAIIVLVLMVRLIMHPITKKSQISMMKMGKMAPLIEEIKKKYANNKEELQRRTMELYKEQGASPILGCLPMLLQMPIWVALYTAVDTNVALRHKGLFPASWHWLTDLSAPDRLIPFSWFGVDKPITVPLVGGLDAINLLPILLCVAMVLQQKFSPQSAMAKSNPQQASQQKMMMIMMPVMMLVFLFTAPSGLNLYIMASTFAGIIEQYFIRKHIREQDEAAAAGTVAVTSKVGSKMGPKKRKPKPEQKFM